MTGSSSKRKRGGTDRNMHGLNSDLNYSTIRRCIRTCSHPTASGNYMTSHTRCTQPSIPHTHPRTPHTKDDAPHNKRTGSQTARESKCPRAGVNSNRFAALGTGEEDEPQQSDHGCDDGEHSTLDKKSAISANVCQESSGDPTIAEVWSTCRCRFTTSAFKALYRSNHGGILLSDHEDRLSKGYAIPCYDWPQGWSWAAFLLEPYGPGGLHPLAFIQREELLRSAGEILHIKTQENETRPQKASQQQ